MLHRITQTLRRFMRDETAAVVAEGVIILPTLAWWYVGSLTFFQAYEAKNVNLKAAYTISDMISREDGSVNAAYINGLSDVFTYLTAGSGSNPAIRVTLLRCSQNCDNDATRVLTLDWSYGTNGKAALVDANLPNYKSKIPLKPLGDRVVMIETFMNYSPSFNVGLTDSDFQNTIITRLRFVPILCFDGITCTIS